jgi:hypothetical protein
VLQHTGGRRQLDYRVICELGQPVQLH